MAGASSNHDPEFRPLPLSGKVRLAMEVLREYLPTRRIMRTSDVVEMVRLARAVRRIDGAAPVDLEHLTALRLGRAVGRTLRILPTDSRCLIQSLLLARLLARRSIPHVLVIGVRQGLEFQAHAWVEHEGQPLLPAGQYQRLTEL